MSSPTTDVRDVPPWLAGLVAMTGPGLGGAVLTAVPYALDAPVWVVVVLSLAGWALGYLGSRTLLRWMYTPR
ncbi:hypothetical protein ACJ5H2_16180 [Nocardioides sp. R1-1]|uniref:hypothetical protein n=1 Tax=Nocardioides sp. R1-1 TaxID=3383502 RepID=UPI0038D24614